MIPYYERENILIYNDSCLDVLPTIPDKSIDLIFSDYPFSIKGHYVDFVAKTASEYARIAKDVCNLVVINNPSNIFKTMRFFENWNLVNGIALIRKTSFQPAFHFAFQHNYALILNKGGIKNKWNGAKKNHDKTFYSDVLEYSNSYRKNNDFHPQAIPVWLTELLIKTLSNENDVVLDPFLGSGTTAEVCKKLNRHLIASEIERQYCEMTKRRIDLPLLSFISECYNNSLA